MLRVKNFKYLMVMCTLIVLTLSISHVSLAHDGPHEVKDMVLSELGNLGTVSFNVTCDAEAQASACKMNPHQRGRPLYPEGYCGFDAKTSSRRLQN